MPAAEESSHAQAPFPSETAPKPSSLGVVQRQMAFCTCFCKQLCKPSSHTAKSLIPSRRSHKIQLYPSCMQQSDRLKSLSIHRVAMFEKIAPTCLPACVCTTNQSSPQRGLVDIVGAGSRALDVLIEGEVPAKLCPLGPGTGRSFGHKKPGAPALAPLSASC